MDGLWCCCEYQIETRAAIILSKLNVSRARARSIEVMFSATLLVAPVFSCATDHFKEICPAGHGYTYSRSDVQISLRQLDDVELQSMGVSLEDESPTYPQFPFSQPSFGIRPQYPIYHETGQLPQYPEYPEYPEYPVYPETPQAPQHPLTPQHPSHPAREPPRQPHAYGKNVFYVGKYLHCMLKR